MPDYTRRTLRVGADGFRTGTSTSNPDLSFNLAGPMASLSNDNSGTIAAGGTSQGVFVANPSRRYLMIQNLSSGTLWVGLGAAAVQGAGSIALAGAASAPGGSVTFEGPWVPSDAIYVVGATTGQAYTAKEG